MVPATGLPKLMAAPDAPLQSVLLAIVFTVGVGFTVTVKVCGVPGQPLADGVTVTVATTGAAVVLVAVKAPMLPVPLKPKPTLAEEVQL
ncbi:hypothetical protein GCM10023188_44970 [Pontibacter saemangeumensis]|uniref:Uncharacterized protein n=1 Tax=Pontibacter saemangeumensis TaxID=1084525 RepID=A0ABP8M5R4_9BACT